MATQTDLIREVLRELEALDATATVAQEDSDAIAAVLPSIIADLAQRRWVAIDLTAIPDWAFLSLVTVVAENAAPRFGRPTDQKALAGALDRLASASRLDRLSSTDLVRLILEYLEVWGQGSSTLDAVAVSGRIAPALANLAARNVIYIADEDSVSDAQLLPLARFIAAWIAPKPVAQAITEAEAELHTLARITIGRKRLLRADPALLGRRRSSTILLR